MTGSAPPPAPLPGQNWRLEADLTDLMSTAELAHAVAGLLKAADVVVLTGELGAGKTTFTRELAQALGVRGQVSSPTFTLSRIHPSEHDSAPDLVHVDAYRTDSAGLESMDLLATLPSSITVIEWGRGLVEQVLVGSSGSWLDLELLHSTVSPDSAHRAAPQREGRGGVVPLIQTDFSESEADILGTPRRAVLRGYGPRWETAPTLPRRLGEGPEAG